MRDLTRWVLRGALAQASKWRTLRRPLGISINLSAQDLLDARLPEFVAMQQARFGHAARTADPRDHRERAAGRPFDRAQGCYMARPMPAVLLDQYLKEHGLPGWGDALAA